MRSSLTELLTRAEPPGAGLPLTSSTAASDAEVVWLAEVATGR